MELGNKFLIEEFDPEVLREYDIRGIVNKNINENTSYTIGRVFGHIVFKKNNSKTVAVGYDGRLTSPKLFKALSKGLIDSGLEVKSIGICPTPMLYFADYYLKTDAAIMITGSHNPSEYNGFKMVLNKHSFFSENIQNFQNIILNKKLEKRKGNITHIELVDNYVLRVLKNISIKRNLKVCWDIGNGAMGVVIDKIISKLENTNNIILNKDVDGNFPNHPADPSNENNLTDLKNKVISNNHDFGVAFDGDADRSVFIDDKGNIISGSLMTCLISDWLFEKKSKIKIVHNVNVQPSVIEYLKRKGIVTIRSKVGHSYIKKIMRDNDADFGGEHSAHFYLRENFYADSGILTLLIFLKILSEKNIQSSTLIENYEFKPSSGEINFIVEDVETSLKIIENSFEGEFDKLDGISYFSDDFWFNVRGSNTEPMLRLNAEAVDQKTLDNIIDKISNIIS